MFCWKEEQQETKRLLCCPFHRSNPRQSLGRMPVFLIPDCVLSSWNISGHSQTPKLDQFTVLKALLPLPVFDLIPPNFVHTMSYCNKTYFISKLTKRIYFKNLLLFHYLFTLKKNLTLVGYWHCLTSYTFSLFCSSLSVSTVIKYSLLGTSFNSQGYFSTLPSLPYKLVNSSFISLYVLKHGDFSL